MSYTKFDVRVGYYVLVKSVSRGEIIVEILEMEGSWFKSGAGSYAYGDIIKIMTQEENPEYFL